MTAEERREFVRAHRTCVFGYGRRNDGPSMTIVYYVMDGDDILVSTMAEREKVWTAFLADPAWIKARDDSEKDGPIIANIKSAFLKPTAFSAVQ